MPWPSVLDEKAGHRLKIGKTAPIPLDDGAVTLAAALGRPFPGIELFDRISDIVFFIKDREARYVAVNETLAHRCKFADKRALIGRKASQVFAAPLGERYEAQDLKVLAEGLSIRDRMELHLYPDGSEGWCLTWKEPLVDADGAIRGLAGISRRTCAHEDGSSL
jgi:PAS domain-containing protein